MKYIIFISCLFSGIWAAAQDIDSNSVNTKLEANAIKVGTIIKKQYKDVWEYSPKGAVILAMYNIGTNNLALKTLTIKDVASGLITKGLYLSTYSTDARNTYVGYIDVDELPGLIKFLDFLVANKQNVEDEGTEYIYTCNDVQFAAYNTIIKKELQWTYQVKVDRYRSYSTVGLQIKNVEEMLQRLKEAVSKLQE